MEEVNLLCSVSGIEFTVAVTLLAELMTPDRVSLGIGNEGSGTNTVVQ